MEIFVEISIIIIITVVVAGILRWFKQPLIIGYIITGIIIGPAIFNLIRSSETIEIFSHIGIALLLFTVGLNINPKILKNVGKISLITGLGQIVFTSVIGFVIGIILGFPTVTSIYIAIALTFSSTIIIMKLLSDKKETDTMYGRIAIGFLLVQDIVVILVLIVVSSLANDFNITTLTISVILKGAGLIGFTLLAGLHILPRLTKSIAKSQEFLLLFSISWCLALASLSYYLNMSIEIGALLAGVTLAMSPYRLEISSKMRPLRDFFIIVLDLNGQKRSRKGSVDHALRGRCPGQRPEGEAKVLLPPFLDFFI
ncbi:MAG: cation:proton antiporter [bacterium]|nr:cation:proton antiporter [bacterium]